VSQSIAQAAAVIFAPALAAITLGIVGNDVFAARIGRNESFNHAGNAVAAAIAGAAAYALGPSAVFYLLAAMSVASLVASWRFRKKPLTTTSHGVDCMTRRTRTRKGRRALASS
jgi:membrane protein implicated in regulation of membrane protease activity